MNIDHELKFSPEMNDPDIHFNDIFCIDDIQRMQDLFSDVTGIASIITNPEGVPITRQSNFCALCDIIRSTQIGLANCIKSDTQNCADISSVMHIKPCLSAGLLDTGAKISVNGIHIANWLIGQVRTGEISLE